MLGEEEEEEVEFVSGFLSEFVSERPPNMDIVVQSYHALGEREEDEEMVIKVIHLNVCGQNSHPILTD